MTWAVIDLREQRHEVHVIPDDSMHLERPDCWCDPEVEKIKSNELITHKALQ